MVHELRDLKRGWRFSVRGLRRCGEANGELTATQGAVPKRDVRSETRTWELSANSPRFTPLGYRDHHTPM